LAYPQNKQCEFIRAKLAIRKMNFNVNMLLGNTTGEAAGFRQPTDTSGHCPNMLAA